MDRASGDRIMTYDELIEKVRALRESRIILTAVELGLADTLAGGEGMAREVAERLGTDLRATELLLNALVALGLVTKTGGRYGNSRLASECLVSTSPGYRGGGLRHHLHLWRTWSQLTDVVRTGRPSSTVRKKSDAAYSDFVRAMYDFGWERAQRMADALDLEGVTSLLDLGGGPGSYSIAFCARYPALRAVVFDRPQALPVASEIVARHGEEDRVSFQAGDFLVDPLGSGYDLVLVSHIIHAYGEEENRRILRKAGDALVPGGRLVLQDYLLDDDRVHPAHSAIFAINMLVNTESGRTYAWSEVESWLEAIGLTPLERSRILDPAGIIIARKPSTGKAAESHPD
jgi:SAM-dependent methyltransferase